MSNIVPKNEPSPAVMGTYGRINVVFDRGEGAWLVAKDGGRYLDFGSGIAVLTQHALQDLFFREQAAAQVWRKHRDVRVIARAKIVIAPRGISPPCIWHEC